MSVWQSRPVLRWIVPASAALAVIGGSAVVRAVAAGADPVLAPRSAAQLLVDLQTARLDGMSGTVVQRANLGLPALPGIGVGGQGAGGGSTDLTSLLSGTHTLRVWYSGPDDARVALLGTLGETDVITHAGDVWVWESRANRATHRKLPTADAGAGTATGHRGGAPEATPPPIPNGLPSFTPQQLADQALAAVDPTTTVTTNGSARVAGRDAYELVLAPRDPASLIASVRIAIDAKAHVPLRVRVFAKDTVDPAIEVAFTAVSFSRPDPAQFTFIPPPGATIVEADRPSATTPTPAAGPDLGGVTGMKSTVLGKGWTSVLVLRMPQPTGRTGGTANNSNGSGANTNGGSGISITSLLGHLPKVSGAWGSGHVLTSALFSVLVTDDGRVFIGAVGQSQLLAAAADPAAKL